MPTEITDITMPEAIVVRHSEEPDNAAFPDVVRTADDYRDIFDDPIVGEAVIEAVQKHDIDVDAPIRAQVANAIAIGQATRWGNVFDRDAGIPSVDIESTFRKGRLEWEDRENLLDAVAMRTALLEADHHATSRSIEEQRGALVDVVDMLDATYSGENMEEEHVGMVFGRGIQGDELVTTVADRIAKLGRNPNVERFVSSNFGDSRAFSMFMHARKFGELHASYGEMANGGVETDGERTYESVEAMHRAASNMYLAARTMRMQVQMHGGNEKAVNDLSKFIVEMEVAMGLSDSSWFAADERPIQSHEERYAYYADEDVHEVLKRVTEFTFPGSYDEPSDGESYPFLIPSEIHNQGTAQYIAPRDMLRLALTKAHAESTHALLRMPDVPLSDAGMRRVKTDIRGMYGRKAIEAVEQATTYAELLDGLAVYIDEATDGGTYAAEDPYPQWSRAMQGMLSDIQVPWQNVSDADREKLARLAGQDADLITLSLIANVVSTVRLDQRARLDMALARPQMDKETKVHQYPSNQELREKYNQLYESDKANFDRLVGYLRLVSTGADTRTKDVPIQGLGKSERARHVTVPQLSLLIGPTGSGKTRGLVSELAAQEFGIDVVIAPAPSDTPDGFKGNKEEYDVFKGLQQLRKKYPHMSPAELRRHFEERTIYLKDEAVKYLDIPRDEDGSDGFSSGRDLLQAKLQMSTGGTTHIVRPSPATESNVPWDEETIALCSEAVDMQNVPIMIVTSLPDEDAWLEHVHGKGSKLLGRDYDGNMDDYGVLRALVHGARRESRAPKEVGELLGFSPDLMGRVGGNVFILKGPDREAFERNMLEEGPRNNLQRLTSQVETLLGLDGARVDIQSGSVEQLAQHFADIGSADAARGDSSWRDVETAVDMSAQALQSWLSDNHSDVLATLKPGDTLEITYEMLQAAQEYANKEE